jgi:hypothetical protein
MNSSINVICLEEEAFYTLLEKVVHRITNKNCVQANKWISPEDAMKLLGIKSKSTLQKLRDEDKIRFSQPEKKIILYDVDSINEYLEKHTKYRF